MKSIRRFLGCISLLFSLSSYTQMDPKLVEFSTVFTSKYQFEAFGTQDVCPVLHEEALAIFRKLGIKNPEAIKVKRMNDALKASCQQEKEEEDKKNKEQGVSKKATATAAFATHSAIFVDEEYFLSLPRESRLFYWGHEATHIKNKDTLRFMVCLALTAITAPVGLALSSSYSVVAGLAFLGVMRSGTLAAIMTFRRYVEAQADAGGELVAPSVNYINPKYSNINDLPFVERVKVWLESWEDDYRGKTY